MNEKIFETVLNEILDEQRESNRQLKELAERSVALEARVSEFERRVGEMTVLAPPADVNGVKEVVQGGVSQVQGQMADGLQRIRATVEGMPKVKGWQISLLPRLGGDDFAYLVKKLVHAAMVMMVVGTAFVFGVRWVDRAYSANGVVASGVTGRDTTASVRAPLGFAGGAEKKRKKRVAARADTLSKKYIPIISDSSGDSMR